MHRHESQLTEYSVDLGQRHLESTQQKLSTKPSTAMYWQLLNLHLPFFNATLKRIVKDGFLWLTFGYT